MGIAAWEVFDSEAKQGFTPASYKIVMNPTQAALHSEAVRHLIHFQKLLSLIQIFTIHRCLISLGLFAEILKKFSTYNENESWEAFHFMLYKCVS